MPPPGRLTLLAALALVLLPARLASAQESGGPVAAVPDPVARDLQRLHATNRTQVALGRVATNEARDARVRGLAWQILDAHRQNDRRLDALALEAGIDLVGPGFRPRYEEGLAAAARLDEAAAAATDRVYLDRLLLELGRSARELRVAALAARRAGQPEIAAFLEDTVLQLHHELRQAAALQSQLGTPRAAARRGGVGKPTETGEGAQRPARRPAGGGGG